MGIPATGTIAGMGSMTGIAHYNILFIPSAGALFSYRNLTSRALFSIFHDVDTARFTDDFKATTNFSIGFLHGHFRGLGI